MSIVQMRGEWERVEKETCKCVHNKDWADRDVVEISDSNF